MQWFTTDSSTIGTYAIRVTAISGCCASSCSLTDYKEFNLIVTSCETDTLSIPTIRFTSPSLTYTVKSTVGVFKFWRDWVVSTGLITEA